MSGREDERVTIVGAGIAGLVAAINFAREGYQTTVFDREPTIGGLDQWHPSIHMTPMEQKEIWDYIGIDLSHCFTPVKSGIVYTYGKKFSLDSKGLYLVERSSRDTSIDSFLYKMALKKGVNFRFSKNLKFTELGSIQGKIVIASGLYKEMYENLNLSHYLIRGWRAHSETDKEDELLIYFNHYTTDYCYLSAKNNLLFCLLFDRGRKPTKEHLERFRKELEKTEGIVFENWTYSTGCSPNTLQLFRDDLILSGSLTGMIDPFLQFGIVGSIISGKIAALALTDRSRAEIDFKNFTKRFKTSRLMKKIYNKVPFRSVFQPMIMKNLDRYRFITRPMFGGIPGFVEKDWLRTIED
jgi:flavin-dependent dehydrogenase